jgi:hypothetical protein
MSDERTIPGSPLPIAYPDTVRAALEAIWDPRCDTDAPKPGCRPRGGATQARHMARVFALDRALEASVAHWSAK